jgi:hypothetical protein
MATFYATGPALIWVAPQTRMPTQYTPLFGGSPRFLGTAEQTPQTEIRRQYHPAYNDLAGAVPFDLNFLGEDCLFSIDLTRWDERVYATLSTSPQQMGTIPVPGGGLVPPGTRGTYSAINGMGTLQAHEGNTITLYLVFPYGFTTTAPNAAGVGFGMPGGYRFHGGCLITDKHHQMGSKYKKLHLTMQFAPVYDYRTFDFCLYDHAVPATLARPAA